MVHAELTADIIPWWVRSNAPWNGSIFDRMILLADDPEEKRIQRLREEIITRADGREGTVLIERARLLTESYGETEGEPEVIRRALAQAHVLRCISLPLSYHQLLVGSPTSALHAVEIEPEFHTTWLSEKVIIQGQEMSELDALAERPNGAYVLSPDDKELLLAEILPYWRQRDQKSVFLRELTRNYPEALAYFLDSQVFSHIVGVGYCHTIQDYASVLTKGLTGIADELKAAANALDPKRPDGMADFERRNLLEGMLILAEATVFYATRYADLMDRMASQEAEPRASELREMSRICRKVPAAPADTWWEALQSWTILHAATMLAEGGASHSAGRFDQYMLPYLTRDLQANRIDDKKAQELLECFFLKFCERKFLRGANSARAVGGIRANDKLTIGGIDQYGRDVTNRLSYMCLEAQAHVHLNDPNVSVRLHRNTPAEFLRCVLEVVRLGGGLPHLISDEVIVPGLVSVCGVSWPDARNYADIGCQENATDPNMGNDADSNGRTNAGYFNFAKTVELALFDGVNALTGQRVAPQTGDPRSFASIEEFCQAVVQQIQYGVSMYVTFNNAFDYAFRRATPTVYHSLMHPGPRRTGIDYSQGGCKYNWTGATSVGLANAADSLAAIEHLVYETRAITWDELLAALRANWQGHEEVRRACLAAPKFGTDDERADRWAKLVLDTFFDALEQYSTAHGGRFVGGLYTMGHYITRGELTAATPDGRRHGEMLADSGCAPSSFAPAKGPTATHRSAARVVDGWRSVNGVTFNQRISQSAVANPRDVAKWAALVRAFVEIGGQSVQYLVADRETLLDAQRQPERYKDLLVRVGGYSALFVELHREVQDSIIARTEQQL